MRNFRLTQLTWSLRRTDGASRQVVLRGTCVIRKQPDLGVHEPGIGERMRGGRSSAEASRARAWGRAPADRGGAAVPVAVVTSRTEAELIADVLRNKRSAGRGVRRDAGGREPQRQPGSSLDAANRQGAAVGNTHPATAGRGGASGISLNWSRSTPAVTGPSGTRPPCYTTSTDGSSSASTPATFTSSWAQQHETACDSGYSSTDNFRVRPTEQMLTKRGTERRPTSGSISSAVSVTPSKSTFEVTFLDAGVQAHVFTFG